MEVFKNSAEVMRKCFIGSVSVGERGQIVIPAEARQRLGLKTGDKMLVFVNPLNSGIFLILPSALDELHRLTQMLRELMEK